MVFLLDKMIAAILIVVLLPVLIVIAMSIFFFENKSFIFTQERTGLHGQKFKIFKFRTMVEHDNERFITQAIENDKRITKIGKFLRNSSLDELPQLFNVLNNTMSLVGPRPHHISHDEYYSARISSYKERFYLKPGISGLAQIHNLRGETATIAHMKKRILYDLIMVKNFSLCLYLYILFVTPISLLRNYKS